MMGIWLLMTLHESHKPVVHGPHTAGTVCTRYLKCTKFLLTYTIHRGRLLVFNLKMFRENVDKSLEYSTSPPPPSPPTSEFLTL